MNWRLCVIASAVLAAPLLASRADAVTIGLLSDFEDGSTQGWRAGMLDFAGAPSNAGTGGPAGVGDNYLVVTSNGGFGPGSRLAVYNDTQWLGDYLAAGVNGLRLDVQNLGVTDIHLRVGVEGINIGGGGQFVSTDAVVVPSGSGWRTVYLPLDAATLTSVGGTDLNATLADVTQIRLLNLSYQDWRAAPVAAQMGLDNIRAIAFSEGDANRDGAVDIFDVAVVSNNWGETGPIGDVNGDHTVDIFDVAVISNHWGEGVNDGSVVNVAAVPEPATLWIAVVALSLGAAGRRLKVRKAPGLA